MVKGEVGFGMLMLMVLDPLLMNAFNVVDLAGACVVTSVEYAEKLGVSRERWIYPLGGAGTRDSYDCESLHEGKPFGSC